LIGYLLPALKQPHDEEAIFIAEKKTASTLGVDRKVVPYYRRS